MMKNLLVIVAIVFSSNYASASSVNDIQHKNDPKGAAEYLMFQAGLIEYAHSQLPSPGDKRCYPSMNYVETTVETVSDITTRTTIIFDYACKNPAENVVQARIEFVEERTDDAPRDAFIRKGVKVTNTK